jgi:hypothetical protein
VSLEEAPATLMLGVVGVVGRVKGARVYDQRPASSDRRISSMRCDTSLLPLRPGAPRRRLGDLPNRCISIASRVSSETVTPRLLASWRRRASSSSGSFTVVRLTVCQHTLFSPRLTANRVARNSQIWTILDSVA